MEEAEPPRSLLSKSDAVLSCTVINDDKRHTVIARDEFSKIDSSNRTCLWRFFQDITKFLTFFSWT